MQSMANRYPGDCRHCGQHVAAEEGLALKDNPDSRWEVGHDGECPLNPHNPHDVPTWTVGGGEGYGARPYRPGDTLRAQWWPRDDTPGPESVPGATQVSESTGRVSGIVTVVTARQRYYADEGMSFGVGDDQGHYYSAQVRAATDDEAASVLAAEARKTAKGELQKRLKHLLAWRYSTVPDAEPPPAGSPELDAVMSLPQVPLRPHDDTRLYSDELYLDEAGGWLWTVVHNGMDGDDWAANNIPGHIAHRHPLTDQRRQLVADLRAMYASVEQWRKAGVPDDAAQLLMGAGIDLHDITAYQCAVTITSLADAHAYLARAPQQWVDAQWEWPRGRRWPAADAARLADAGIIHEQAETLRAAGFGTVEDILAARPPQLPGTAGRYILNNCKIGAATQITDDPAEAQKRLDRDPASWQHWVHVPDITALHVARRDWQLWSNDELTIGSWCERREHRERRRSLTTAAETAIGVLAAAANPDARDRAVWQPLLDAVDHQRETITEDSVDGFSSGEFSELIRHSITLQDGTISHLWEVVTGWWYYGEDADVTEEHWISTSEDRARSRYREHRPQRR